MAFAARPARIGLRQRLTANQRSHLVNRRVQPASVVAAAESRRNLRVDHPFGRKVGDRALEGFGHLDANPAITPCDHDQHTVANVASAELPGVCHPLAVGVYVLGLGGGHQQHHDLTAGLFFDRGQFFNQRCLLRLIERFGLIYHRSAEQGHALHTLGKR